MSNDEDREWRKKEIESEIHERKKCIVNNRRNLFSVASKKKEKLDFLVECKNMLIVCK